MKQKVKIKTWDSMVSIGEEIQFFGEPCIDMMNNGEDEVSFLQDMEDLLPEDRIVDLEYNERLKVWELPDGNGDPDYWEIFPCMIEEVLDA